jgi:hypothetical protein
MALLTALFATTILMALGLSVALLGTADVTLAAHDREARGLTSASHAAATMAVADLHVLPSWSALIAAGLTADTSASPGRFVDSTLTPAAPWGGAPLDLRALTMRLQAQSDAVASLGGDAPVWRLFEYGPVDRLVPGVRLASSYYLVAWVADDRADGDGDASTDSNGVVIIRAAALGPGSGRIDTEVSVFRQPAAAEGAPDSFRILTIRPGH